MIECIRFKEHEKGCLQGFADLYIKKWGIEIPGFTLWEKDGRRWVNAPSTRYTDRDGQEKNKALFYFKQKSDWETFGVEALKAIDEWKQKNEPNVFNTPSPMQTFDSSGDINVPRDFSQPPSPVNESDSVNGSDSVNTPNMPNGWEEIPF